MPGAIRGQQLGGNVTPFTGIDRYRAIYRAAFDYHEKNLTRLTERTHKDIFTETAAAVDYWTAAAQELEATAERFGGDPFIVDLLKAIYADLERTFKARKPVKQSEPTSAGKLSAIR